MPRRNVEDSGPGDGKLQVGKAEVDGDSARLLFRQAVGIGAGQRFHERALAVIDVTGGGDDEMLWLRHHRALAKRPGVRSQRPGPAGERSSAGRA